MGVLRPRVDVQLADLLPAEGAFGQHPLHRLLDHALGVGAIQDLLRHTSGIVYGQYTSNPKVKELYAKEGVDWKDVTPAEQIERLAKVPLAHQPGSTFEYSLSVDVLGRVVEVLTGMPLGQFLQERIFAPLAMTDSAFIVPKEKVDRLAQPFATDKSTNAPINLLDVTVATVTED